MQDASWDELLALPHLTAEQMAAVEKRLSAEETQQEREQEQLDQRRQALETEMAQLAEDVKKMAELERLLIARTAKFHQLEERQREFEQRKQEYAARQKQCVRRQSAIKGVEREMGPVERTKLMSIMTRGCELTSQLQVLAKEDDQDLFLSVTNEQNELLCEQFVPRSLLL